MRSIRERLNAMQPEASTAVEHQPSGVPIEAVTFGSERITDRGTHFVVESKIPDPTETASSWDRLLHLAIERSQPSDRYLNATDILFLDTETTGLDRGTGTHVFLVGLGYFAHGQFHVEQHFLRDLHEEPSLLCDLEERISNVKVLVTFNGRGFDWPMLMTRFILHGHREIPELLHWDLLTSSRRLWRNRLRDCSLGSLERHILGVERVGDVPGFLIPDIYFDYLRTRDARPLRPVFSHNHEDIVSLARLAECLLLAADDPLAKIDHPIDQVSYGLVLLNQGKSESAEQLIRSNLDSPHIEGELRFRAYRVLSEHYKRHGQWREAAELWQQMADYHWSIPEQAIYPLVELAKVHEHRLKDFRRALQFTERALNVTDLHGWTRDRGELLHRFGRLQRRMNRPS